MIIDFLSFIVVFFCSPSFLILCVPTKSIKNNYPSVHLYSFVEWRKFWYSVFGSSTRDILGRRRLGCEKQILIIFSYLCRQSQRWGDVITKNTDWKIRNTLTEKWTKNMQSTSKPFRSNDIFMMQLMNLKCDMPYGLWLCWTFGKIRRTRCLL